ncbi:DUF998 domain-containing protein [Thalassotalea fusca]
MEAALVKFSAYSGVLASVWIFFGVYIASLFYPNYDHYKQFCSELGAAGSPTEKLSPRINNYPLGIIFCMAGWYFWQLPEISFVMKIVGLMVIVHGMCTWVAGYFPMDADPYTKTPTKACNIHSWAGFIMLMSLIIAPIMVILMPENQYFGYEFRIFTIGCLVATIYFMIKLANAFKNKTNPGLHQRLSYSAQLIWLSGLSIVTAN